MIFLSNHHINSSNNKSIRNILFSSVMALMPITVYAQATADAQQVDGFYKFLVGSFQVTALYDGYVSLPSTVFEGETQPRIKQLLADKFVDNHNGIQTAVNAYLVNTGNKLVLIDSGAASCFGSTTGSILKNLVAAGYQPEQVDAVLLTHLHPDHACGISINGQKAFPNAVVYATKQEADFWLNSANLDKYPAAKHQVFKAGFENAQAALKPYQQTQQFKTYQAGDKLIDGIDVVPSVGHTVGHYSYLVTSKNQKLLVLGDVVHSHAVQFKQPSVSFEYDYDAKQAVATRYQLFTAAAKSTELVAGAHLPFPGVGHIKQVGKKQFEWIPIEFSPLPKTKD